jgi:hypothetical protein
MAHNLLDKHLVVNLIQLTGQELFDEIYFLGG